MAKRKNQHVVPHRDGCWAVKGEGTSKATSVHNTQRDAINAAREIARNQKSEIVIHRPDGQIRERDSYGNDSFPPRSNREALGQTAADDKAGGHYMALTTRSSRSMIEDRNKSKGTKVSAKTKPRSIDASLWEEFLRAARRQNRNPTEELNNFMRERLEIWDDQQLDEQIQREVQASGYQEEDAVELVRQYRRDKDEQRAST